MYNPNLANQIAQAKPKYNAWLEEGTHILALSQIREDISDPNKPVIYVDFVYIESDTQPLGSSCTQSYRLWEHGKYPGGLENALTDLRHLIAALSGDNDAQQVAQYSTAAIGQNAARGILVRCIATNKSQGKFMPDNVTPKKKFVSPLFYHKDDQTPETIQQMRGYLDQVSPEKQAAPVQPQQPQAQYGQQPAPQQYAQQPPQQPAPQQYAQQPPTQQYAPPPAAPQQYAPPQQPAGAPLPPQQAPQQYAPPQVAPPTQHPPAAPQPPQQPQQYAPPPAAPAPQTPQGQVALPNFPIPGI